MEHPVRLNNKTYSVYGKFYEIDWEFLEYKVRIISGVFARENANLIEYLQDKKRALHKTMSERDVVIIETTVLMPTINYRKILLRIPRFKDLSIDRARELNSKGRMFLQTDSFATNEDRYVSIFEVSFLI